MAEYRTSIQIAADKLDLDVFNLVSALDCFANKYHREDVREMSAIIDGMRHRVRRHMHRKDLEVSS
ncbi:hypothetical protein [Rhizobium sp. RCAM05973]|uniref:hypothetical protein n=1 Tax=Rhizobium sp. RCAM05973 TaxID=2994066 RepID=UPI0022EBF5B3|nr:hypothetical protein [Rhizobium sp. RCAM05973]